MIITKSYAKKLEKAGKATLEPCTISKDGECYQIVTRHDVQRVDNYKI